MRTTLKQIRAHYPCGLDPRENPLADYQKLFAYLSANFDPDTPISIAKIIDSNCLSDALYCLRTVKNCDTQIINYAVFCAKRVEHLDPTGLAKICNDIAARFANGEAKKEELITARAAALKDAQAAAQAAQAKEDAARASSWGAALDSWGAAVWAARAAAMAKEAAASAAALDAWGAALAARSAAWAVDVSAWAAEAAAQEKELLRICAEWEADHAKN